MNGVRYVRSTTTSASRKPASTSPLRIFQREMTLPVGSSRGASGRIAASGSKTPGRSAYSTATRRAASSAASSVSAATSATGSPEEAHDLVREHLGPRAQGAHRRRLAGDVAEEHVVRDVPGGEDAPDARARASAALVSIRRIRAEGRGARTTLAWSMPPIAKSSA